MMTMEMKMTTMMMSHEDAFSFILISRLTIFVCLPPTTNRRTGAGVLGVGMI